MAGRKISAVKLKELYYGDVIVTTVTGQSLHTSLKTMTKVDNVHGETFKYEEAEPSTTSHKNALTGKTYREDTEEGEVKISFVIGEYDFETKAALQGGAATTTSWARPEKAAKITKAIVGLTEDDVYIVFPKASILASGADADKAIGLGVVAKPLDTGVAGHNNEYWFDASSVTGL